MTYQDLYDEQNAIDANPLFIAVSFIVCALIVGLIIYGATKIPHQTQEERTAELCMEYAKRDHEKEIAPERYKWLGKKFVDEYDWYGSCIAHSRPIKK